MLSSLKTTSFSYHSTSQEIYDPFPALLLTCCYGTSGKAISPRYASLFTLLFEVFIQTSRPFLDVLRPLIPRCSGDRLKQPCLSSSTETEHAISWTSPRSSLG